MILWFYDLQRSFQPQQVCGVNQGKVLSREMCVSCHPTAVLKAPESEQPRGWVRPLETHSPVRRVSVRGLVFPGAWVGMSCLLHNRPVVRALSCVWGALPGLFMYFTINKHGINQNEIILGAGMRSQESYLPAGCCGCCVTNPFCFSISLLCLTAHLRVKANTLEIPNPFAAVPALLSQGRRSGFAAAHCTSHLGVLI